MTFIVLKLIAVLIYVVIISPFVGMLIAFVGGSTVAPNASKRDNAIAFGILFGVVFVLYIFVPFMVFFL